MARCAVQTSHTSHARIQSDALDAHPPPPPFITTGRFSDAANGKGGEEEVVTIRGGHYLEVARLTGVPEGSGGGEAACVRLEPVLRQDAFSTLRSLCKIRPVGASKVRTVV